MPEFERSSHGDLFVEYNVVLPSELSMHTRRSELIAFVLFCLRRL